jgi:hypothetical protein
MSAWILSLEPEHRKNRLATTEVQPQVQHIVVCNPRRNALLKEASKSDKVDARKLHVISQGFHASVLFRRARQYFCER